MILRITSMTLLLFPCIGFTIQQQEPPAVVERIEDDTDGFIKQLNNDGTPLDGAEVRQEMRDVYSGVSSIRVTPFQRHTARIQGLELSHRRGAAGGAVSLPALRLEVSFA